MQNYLLAAAAATTLLAAVPATAQNLIVNGGFENQTDFTDNPYYYSNSPTGWATNTAWDTNPYNAVKGGAYGAAHSGSDSVRFGSSNTTDPTTLSQTFADVFNAIYSVTLYAYNGLYIGEPGNRPQNYLTASVGGQSFTIPDNVGTYTYPGCAALCYVPVTFTFVGTGSDTLSIAAKADYNYWQLDDVSVTLVSLPTTPTTGAVPEPATWAMMLLGFGATGYAMRRRPTVTARIRFA